MHCTLQRLCTEDSISGRYFFFPVVALWEKKIHTKLCIGVDSVGPTMGSPDHEDPQEARGAGGGVTVLHVAVT